MNQYLESYEKYKNYKLPQIGEVFSHPTNKLANKKEKTGTYDILYRVLSYDGDNGVVETIHSEFKQLKTLHWIRKTYNHE